jgi:hypothetical protein
MHTYTAQVTYILIRRPPRAEARAGVGLEHFKHLVEEEGGLAVRVPAAPVVGNGEVEDHPLCGVCAFIDEID